MGVALEKSRDDFRLNLPEFSPGGRGSLPLEILTVVTDPVYRARLLRG